MTKINFLAMMLLGTTTAIGQNNLVENGDFETIEKIKKLGEIEKAASWGSPTAAKADLYVAGKIEQISIPNNLYGMEDAKSGAAYAGIVGFSYGDKLPRTYLMTRLSSSLEKGAKYCVQYSISLAEGSKYACDNMGAIFSKKEYGLDSKGSLVEKASVKSNKVYSATYGWDKVCEIFIAEGGEKFMIIGNFENTAKVRNEKNKVAKGVAAEPIVAAYYYIDDVTVTKIEEGTTCDCATTDPSEVFSTLIYQKQVVWNEKMTPEEKAETVEMHYAFGSSELTPLGRDMLKDLAELLIANPTLKIKLMGHSDALEDEAGTKNVKYSDMAIKRVGVVLQQLKALGIDESRIIAESKGSTEVNPEIKDYDDEEMKQAKNRRVNIKIVP